MPIQSIYCVSFSSTWLVDRFFVLFWCCWEQTPHVYTVTIGISLLASVTKDTGQMTALARPEKWQPCPMTFYDHSSFRTSCAMSYWCSVHHFEWWAQAAFRLKRVKSPHEVGEWMVNGGNWALRKRVQWPTTHCNHLLLRLTITCVSGVFCLYQTCCLFSCML